jgi:DNA-binding MarR family transcriptional regulator
MTKKQEITMSQAKILVYLSVVHNTRKYVAAIDAKVGNDYSYTMRVLQRMVQLGWLKKHQLSRKMFYDLTPLAPLELARKCLLDETLQRDLEANYTQEELPQVMKNEIKQENTEQTEEEIL